MSCGEVGENWQMMPSDGSLHLSLSFSRPSVWRLFCAHRLAQGIQIQKLGTIFGKRDVALK